MINGSLIIGITGTIASGKSLLGTLLAERGYLVIDTDQIVHDLFAHSSSLRSALEARFGRDILSPDGSSIDRTRLGTIVFSDQRARHDLEGIVHPETIAECQRRIEAGADGIKPVFVLVPLLLEAKQEARYDRIWTVRTDEHVLRERLRQRNNLTEAEIDSRLEAQLTQEEKCARAHLVINNSGSIEATAEQLDRALATL